MRASLDVCLHSPRCPEISGKNRPPSVCYLALSYGAAAQDVRPPPPGFRWRCTGRRLNDFPDRRQTDHDLDPLKILTCRCEMICTAQIHDLYSTDPSQEAVGTRRLVADFSAPTRYHELRTGGCWRIILVGWVSCSLFPI